MMSGDDKHPFRPPVYLRNNMLQTFLGSKRPGFFQNRPLVTAAKTVLLSTKKGIRLKGAFSLSESKKVRGLVMLLHGWEGSITSKYILSAGQRLMNCGFNVFRLNFRDHGGTHHLNDGLFYSTLLNEVYDALTQAARMIPKQPVFLCGFSLGGNFAIRIAARYAAYETCKLTRVVSISPVLDPDKATDRIDGNPWILRYFLKKWRTSLIKKQTLYPDHYDFSDILKMDTLREMTARLLERHTRYR